eukprot:1194341-Prorocentrum_minimum.AAC.2
MTPPGVCHVPGVPEVLYLDSYRGSVSDADCGGLRVLSRLLDAYNKSINPLKGAQAACAGAHVGGRVIRRARHCQRRGGAHLPGVVRDGREPGPAARLPQPPARAQGVAGGVGSPRPPAHRRLLHRAGRRHRRHWHAYGRAGES